MDLHGEGLGGIEQFDEQGKFAPLQRPLGATADEGQPLFGQQIGEELASAGAVGHGRCAVVVCGYLPAFGDFASGQWAAKMGGQVTATPNVIFEHGGEEEGVHGEWLLIIRY